MKVSYVTMQFPAPSETFASNDVRWLAEHGHEVSVHGLRGATANIAELLRERRLEGLKVTHNGVWPSLSGLVAAMRYPGRLVDAVRWLISECRVKPVQLLRSFLLLPRAFDILDTLSRERPDVVHVYWGHYPSIVGHLVQRNLPGAVTSISFVAYDLEMEYGGSGSVARKADVVRTLARTNVAHVAAAFGVDPERVQIVYDGIDVERIAGLGAGVSKIPGRIVTVGRLTEAKGMYDALEVLARVRRRVPDARLRVLGDGREAAGLRNRAELLGISDAVDFLGHVSHDRVMEELARAEVLLLLTKASGERLPNVVKEGMASRCLCVTTPTPGIDELIEDGRHGFIVTAGDVEASAEVVERVVAHDLDVSAMVEAAHRQVTTRFDLDTSCARYVELWQRAVHKKRHQESAHPEWSSDLVAS